MAGTGENVQGVYSVLPTPFTGSGDIDEASLRRVVDLALAAGVDGLTALGVTSEVARFSEADRRLATDVIVAQVDGRVPIVVGTTADGMRSCIEYSRAAKAAGAAAVMVSPPRMPKLNSDAVLRHYTALAEAVNIPIVVQDYPPISGYAMEPWLLARIADEVSSVRAIKLEDPPTPVKIARILERTGKGRVAIFGGLGGVFLLEELLAGSAGAMTGFAYPESLVEIVRRYRAGDIDTAADVFYRFVPLMRFEFQEGIGMAIRKEILRRRGAISDAATRAPGAQLDSTTLVALDRLLRWTAAQEGASWISA
ncbi:MAG: dihydrodipicolinate synthase family protein [Vicinamibacteraceae bacterium]